MTRLTLSRPLKVLMHFSLYLVDLSQLEQPWRKDGQDLLTCLLQMAPAALWLQPYGSWAQLRTNAGWPAPMLPPPNCECTAL